MTTLDILHDIAPQFTDDTKNARFISYADVQVSECKFGASYQLALAYLAAHLLEISTRSGGMAGFINNIEEGDRTIGFTTINPKDSDLMTTSYGVEFKRLSDMFVISAMFVTGSDPVSTCIN
jgi:hypothetical protein